jgi:glucosamine-6-phosphate deaminase
MGIAPENRLLIDGKALDPAAEAARYAALVAENPADVIVVGIGPDDGHVGFNPAGSAVDSRTRIVELPEKTRKQQASYEGSLKSAAATHGITQGIGDLVQQNPAAKMFLWAAGASKAAILATALEGPVTEKIAASYCRLRGEKLTVIADAAAGSALTACTPR